MRHIKLVATLIIAFSSLQVSAQNPQNTGPAVGADGKDPIGRIIDEEITIDFTSGTISPKSLPFDVPFKIKAELPKSIINIQLTIIEKKYGCSGEECRTTCQSCHQEKITKEIQALAADTTDKKSQKKIIHLLTTLPPQIKQQYIEQFEQYIGMRRGADDTTRTEVRRDDTRVQGGHQAGHQQTPTASPETPEIRAYRHVIDMVSHDGCDCDECFEPDFRFCQSICPTPASFLTQTKKDDVIVNVFNLRVPALKANTRYQFYFKFTKSMAEENDTLDKIRMPLIRDFIFEEFSSGAIDTAQDRLQAALRNAIVEHYRNSMMIEIDYRGQLIDPVQATNFGNAITTTAVGPGSQDINTLLGDLDTNKQTYETDRNNTASKWTAILGSPVYAELLNGFSQLAQPTDDEARSLQKILLLNQIVNAQTNVAGGVSNITKTSEALPIFQENKDPLQCDLYTANITAYLAFITDLKNQLQLLTAAPTKRLRISLTPAELITYNTHLASEANGTINLGDRNTLNQLRAKDGNVLNRLIQLDKALTDLATEQQKVIRDIATHKRILGLIQTYFLKISRRSFDSIVLEQSTPLNTTADFITRTSYYVSLDAGLAVIFYEKAFSNEIQPYYGVNFHMGPINKQRTYKLFPKCNTLKSLWKNTSFILGVTINSLNEGRRKNTLKDASILTGVGLRIFEPVRLSYGGVWNKVESENPLNSKTKLKYYSYVSLSFDLDVGKYLKKVSTKIFGEQL
jgi:hypothetical protein